MAYEFSQGDWSLEEREIRIIVRAEGFHDEVASFPLYEEYAETPEQEIALHNEQMANATLFVAAPKMYRLLKRMQRGEQVSSREISAVLNEAEVDK